MVNEAEKADRVTAESTHWAIEEQSFARTENDLIDGVSYSTGNLFIDVAQNVENDLLLRNPAGSEEMLFTVSTIRTTAKFFVRKIRNVGVSDAGTLVNIVNERTDTGTNTSALASIGATVDKTAGDPYTRKVIGSGTGSSANFATATFFKSLITPGDNMLWEMVNPGSANQDVSIDVDFVAMPEKVI